MALRLIFVESDELGPGRLGTTLRRRRLERDLSLGGVARILRIHPRYLAALEAGRFQELPGRIYAIGFVRAYAKHLGLDAEEAVVRLKGELEWTPIPKAPPVRSVRAEGGWVAALRSCLQSVF